MKALHGYLVAASLYLPLFGSALAECTPAGQDESRFEPKGAEVVDRKTNLTWARCSVGQNWEEGKGCAGSAKKFLYDEASKAKWPDGWRIPTPDELKGIVAANCRNPAVDAKVFPGTPPDPYWAIDKIGCWLVNFGPGALYGPNSYLCGYGNVSAVRLIKEGI
jgi:hypothetical protein